VVESLRAEGIDKFTIFIDGTVQDKNKQKQEILYKYLSNIDWADFDIVQRKTDLGLAKSLVLSVSETLRHHDSIIVLEDDCKVNKGFHQYFENALEVYKDNKRIGAICGYSYPVIQEDKKIANSFLAQRFTPWGWATWKDRWDNYEISLKNLKKWAHKKQVDISMYGKDLSFYINDESYINHKQDIWSLNWILSLILNEQLVLYPKNSYIENIGFDGTGIHSDKTDVFNIKNHSEKVLDKKSIKQSEYSKYADDIIKSYLEKNSIKTMKFNGEQNY